LVQNKPNNATVTRKVLNQRYVSSYNEIIFEMSIKRTVLITTTTLKPFSDLDIIIFNY